MENIMASMNVTEPEGVGLSANRLQRIDSLMQGYVDRDELAGMLVTLARRGQTVYLEKFGWMDREARRPMQFDTIFRIASMTKPVTSVAITMLYEEGHFNLNTPVSKFIPAFKDTQVFVKQSASGEIELAPLEREITFRHLFTHTAGLSYGFNPDDPIDRLYQAAGKELEQSGTPLTNQRLVEQLAHLPLAFQPGTKWRYSYAIDVLGYLVELISGLSLDEYLRTRIFEPLGMVDTTFYVSPEKASRLAAVYGHSPEKEGLQRLDMPVQEQPPSYLSGGGGLFSSLPDYSRFAQMLVNGGELDGVRLLSPRTVALMQMNHTPAAALPYGFIENDLYHAGYGYGLGMRVLMDVSQTGQDGSVGEFGWDGAFSTYFWIDRQEAMYGLIMLQHYPNAYYPIHPQFKALAYQALVD
jgi:CubicO group peptidase (beta-lactamase class C family)